MFDSMPKQSVDGPGQRVEFRCKKKIYDAVMGEIALSWENTKKAQADGVLDADFESISSFSNKALAREVVYRRKQREQA
jgi:hypothetical protein